MKTICNVTQAQAGLMKITKAQNIVAITRHKEVAGFYVPREEFESIMETMEILGNPKAMAAINRGKAGKSKYRDLEDVAKEFGL